MDPLNSLSLSEYTLVIDGKKDLTKYNPEEAFDAVCKKISLLWLPILGAELAYTAVYSPQHRYRSLKEEAALWATIFYPLIAIGMMFLYQLTLNIDKAACQELREIGRFINARQNEPSPPERAFHGIADYWRNKTAFPARVYYLFYRALAFESASGAAIKEMPTFAFTSEKAFIRLRGKKLTLAAADELAEKIKAFLTKLRTY